MRLEEAEQMSKGLRDRAEADGDKVLVCYFSREEDKYQAVGDLDSGDALIVIGKLIELFDLSPAAIAAMEKAA